MTLERLQDYFVGQKFTIKCEVFTGTEVFEIHVEDIGRYIKCFYRYVEPSAAHKLNGTVRWEKWALDDMLRDAYYGDNGFELLGWIPIKPINSLPEELFTI